MIQIIKSKVEHPTIRFFWSEVLQELILKSKYDWKKMEKFVNSFSHYFEEHKNKIMNGIEKYTGFKWGPDENIPVWIMNSYHKSIPEPIFLNNYNNDKKFVLFQFIHLLTQNLILKNNLQEYFIQKKGKFQWPTELEAISYIITKKVAEGIFNKNELKKLLKKAEFNGFNKYLWKRVEEIEQEWDVEKQTLNSWKKEVK